MAAPQDWTDEQGVLHKYDKSQYSSGASTPSGASSGASGPVSLRYPLRKIESADDYLEIRVVEYKAPDFGGISAENLNVPTSTDILKSSGNIENPIAYIYLPMPQGISDSSSIGWGEDSLNTAAAFGAKAVSNTLKSANLVSGGWAALQDTNTALQTAATSGSAQQAVLSQFTSALVNSLGGNTSPEGLLSRATGKVMNPNMELLFKSVSLRSFSFRFDLAPRDSMEGERVKQIIKTFKKTMAPKSGGYGTGGGGIFISAPNVYQLKFKTGNKQHPFLNSFKPMALTNMTVNYTASGSYATYEDATPVHMQLTLQFQELNPIYSEDYDDSTIGVGY